MENVEAEEIKEIKAVLRHHNRLLHQILRVLETKKHVLDTEYANMMELLEEIFLSGQEAEKFLYPD